MTTLSFVAPMAVVARSIQEETKTLAQVFGNPYDREGTSVNLPAAIAAGIVQKLFCSIAVGCCAAALLTFFLRFASLKLVELRACQASLQCEKTGSFA